MESKTIDVSAAEYSANEMIKNAISMLIAECLMDKEEDADFTKRLAISALQKQLPKKPIFWANGCDKDGNFIYDVWNCPNCDTHYEVDFDYRFCPNCGQALDWSDEV